MEEFFKKYDFLNQGHILGLGFEEGVLFFEIMAREPKFFEYTFGTLNAGEGSTEWDTIPKDNNRNYIEPITHEQIYQFYFGVKPSTTRLYMRFPAGTDRWQLIDPLRVSSTNGALLGEWSPYDSPSIMTEIFTLKDAYPAFKVDNPTDSPATPSIRFLGMSYEYLIVYDHKLIEDYLELKRRSKLYYLGGVEPHVRTPQWLINIKGVKDLLKYSMEVLNRVHGR